jgi:hypothetical protein
MKKKLFLILVVCLLILPCSKNSYADLSINGNDWNNWSQGSKISFVYGWILSGKSAFDNLPLNLNKLDEANKYMELVLEWYKNAGILMGGVTIGQIIDVINEVYSDSRTKYTNIIDIMPLVNGRLTQGWTKVDLDEVIALTVKLEQCEAIERQQGKGFKKECSLIRKQKNEYLKKIRGK